MKPRVTFTITRDLSDVDFTDCGDGCGGDATLEGAKYNGEKIDHFASNGVDAAHAAMVDYLGNVRDTGERYHQRAIENDRAARAMEQARKNAVHEKMAARAALEELMHGEFVGDPVSMARRNR